MTELVLYGMSAAVLAGLYWHHKNPDKVEVLQKVKSSLKLKRFLFRRGKQKMAEKGSSLDSGGDEFSEPQEAYRILRKEGFKSSPVIVAIDFSASNEWQGRSCCAKRSLHHSGNKPWNPYRRALACTGYALTGLCSGHPIQVYGFGALRQNLFAFGSSSNTPQDLSFDSFSEVVSAYTTQSANVELGEGSGFDQVIRKSIRQVKATGQYHLLVIIGDCQMPEEHEVKATQAAIVEASNQPLSIVIVGVGDGPFPLMSSFDEMEGQRRFDNVHFVNFQRLLSSSKGKSLDSTFTVHMLAEVPRQYRVMKDLGILSSEPTKDETDMSSETTKESISLSKTDSRRSIKVPHTDSRKSMTVPHTDSKSSITIPHTDSKKNITVPHTDSRKSITVPQTVRNRGRGSIRSLTGGQISANGNTSP